MNAKIPYKCSCGGELKWSKANVEFFGIYFGMKDIFRESRSNIYDYKLQPKQDIEV